MTKTERPVSDVSTRRIGQTQKPLPVPWKPSILGVAPLPIAIGMVAVFDATLPGSGQLSSSLVFEPQYLNAVLSTVFLAFASYAVAYLALKSYLETGWFFLILLGCGALAWGSGSLLAGWMTNLPSGPNPAITISNTGALVASFFHVASGIWHKVPGTHSNVRARRSIPILSYCAVLAYTVVYAMLALEGMTPVFFVRGVGQTISRIAVLGGAAALFSVSSILFARRYFSLGAPSRTLYWYSLALALTGVGLAAVFFGRAPGDPISWTGRTAMFLGGTYFVKAARTAF